MRRWLLSILVLLTLLLLGAGVLLALQRVAQPQLTSTVSPAALAAVPRITVEELRGELATANPPLVWDLRPASAFADGHIPGSRVLTLDAIPDAAADLDNGLPIVTVCA